MKFEFTEAKWGIEITLKPENPMELAQLLRFAKNAKAEKPGIYVSISDSPYCNIHMKKINEKKQINSISK